MPKRRADLEAERVLSGRSDLMFAAFACIFRRTFARDFHALRISRSGPPPSASVPRLVLYANHPSWWDGVAFVILADLLFPGRAGYVPIEAAMLRRYGFMKRIGAFGIEPGGREGGAAFLAVARRILQKPEGLMLVTAQGRFTDSRVRPVKLRPGIAHLARWAPDATFMPLALDYVFWDERKPELLMRFGPPLPALALRGLPVAERVAVLAGALEDVMDKLAAEAIARDDAAFQTLTQGRVGVGGVYDLWRRGRAYLRGERFSPAHGGQP